MISLLLIGAALRFPSRQLDRLADRLFDAVVEWVLEHRNKEAGPEPIEAALYGPDGQVLKRVWIPQGEGDAPPQDKTPERN